MLFSGLSISDKPKFIIGELFFTELGEPYIESCTIPQSPHIERSEVFLHTIKAINSVDEISLS